MTEPYIGVIQHVKCQTQHSWRTHLFQTCHVVMAFNWNRNSRTAVVCGYVNFIHWNYIKRTQYNLISCNFNSLKNRCFDMHISNWTSYVLLKILKSEYLYKTFVTGHTQWSVRNCIKILVKQNLSKDTFWRPYIGSI